MNDHPLPELPDEILHTWIEKNNLETVKSTGTHLPDIQEEPIIPNFH